MEKNIGKKNYQPVIGPVFGKHNLQNSQQDSRAFRLPYVSQTSEIDRFEEVVPDVRKWTWKNLDSPPQFDFPKVVYLIESLGDMFDSALQHLVNCDKLGIKLEGREVNRSGSLHSISFSSTSHVYVFDVKKLKERCFKHGLKHVLENEDILKVCHDVRGTSDMLHRQYNVTLENVFDTALADITFFSNKQPHNLLPVYLRSYQSVCVEYLGISRSSLFFQGIRNNKQEEDANLFLDQPFTREMILALARNVMYLLPLHSMCEIALMCRFRKANDIFLRHLRECTDHEAELLTERIQEDPHKVPQEVDGMFHPKKADYRKKGECVEGVFIHQDVGNYLPTAICRF